MAELHSILTRSECRHVKAEAMPTDACQLFHEREGCRNVLIPLTGEYCVYGSYGSYGSYGAAPRAPIHDGGVCCT